MLAILISAIILVPATVKKLTTSWRNGPALRKIRLAKKICINAPKMSRARLVEKSLDKIFKKHRFPLNGQTTFSPTKLEMLYVVPTTPGKLGSAVSGKTTRRIATSNSNQKEITWIAHLNREKGGQGENSCTSPRVTAEEDR